MNSIFQEIVNIIRDGCKDQKCKNCHCKSYKHGVGCGEMYRAMKIYDLLMHESMHKPKTIICKGCLSQIDVNDDEVKCPCCGTVNVVEEEEEDDE